jgi:hypothetical protein
MNLNSLIQQIQLLTLSERFFVMEQTLKSIKEDELNHEKQLSNDDALISKSNKKSISHLVSEKSLAKDWLSEEDNRWDNLLKNA